MSGKRIVEETVCEHGEAEVHWMDRPASIEGGTSWTCRGGSRRVLTEGQYVLIEKVDGEWPGWAEERLGDPPLYELSPAAQQSLGMDGEAVKVKPRYILDALSDHTERTP